MASAIGPGDWIECVRTKLPDSPNRGRIFRCEEIVFGYGCKDCGKECGGLVLFGVRSDHPTGSYSACGFRPIYRPKADLIEALKAPVTRTPQVVREKSRETA